MLRETLQRFVKKEAQPLEMKYFSVGELSSEERAHLRQIIEQLGLWGLMVPEEFGGGGVDMVTACLIEEELGKTFIPIEVGDVPPLLYACEGEQITRYLEPALAGERYAIIAVREPGLLQSDDWVTTASPNGNEYILNGCKALATLPSLEDFFVLITQTPMGPTAFLLNVNHPGLSVDTNNEEAVLLLQDCHAHRDSILGEPGRALTISVEAAQHACIRLCARYLGIVERLLEMTVEYAKDWYVFNLPLAKRPAIQRMLAEIRVEVESVRWLVYHAAWQVDEGRCNVTQGQLAQIRLATGEMLKHAVDRVTMVYAGPAPSGQIEPHQIVQKLVPSEILELALDNARAVIAVEMLDLLED